MKKKKKAYEPPADMPRAFLCQLSNRPMSGSALIHYCVHPNNTTQYIRLSPNTIDLRSSDYIIIFNPLPYPTLLQSP